MSEAPADRRRFRPRLSLLNLLLLMAIVAMAVVVWRQSAELAPLREEVVGYRQQLGHLTIPDDEVDKIHAITVEAEHQHEWRFRVYLPEGRGYRLCFREGLMPGKTLELYDQKDYYAAVRSNGSGSSRSLEPGEHLLAFRVVPADGENDRSSWRFETREVGEGSLGSTTMTVPWMADQRAWGSSTSMVSGEQKSFAADEPLPLKMVRRGTVTERPGGGWSSASPDHDDDADGFAWWIESR